MRVKLHNTWPRTGTGTGTLTEGKIFEPFFEQSACHIWSLDMPFYHNVRRKCRLKSNKE